MSSRSCITWPRRSRWCCATPGSSTRRSGSASSSQVLYEISRRLAAAEDTGQMLSLLIEETVGLLGGRGGRIRLLEGEDLVVGARTRSAARIMARPRIRVGESLSGIVVATGRPVAVEDLQNDTRYDAARQGGRDPAGFPGIPGRAAPDPAGEPSAVSSSSARIDGGSAPRTSRSCPLSATTRRVAIHKARLYAESRAREEEVTKLYEVTAHLAATLDVDSVLDQIVAKTIDLLGCDASGVYVSRRGRGAASPSVAASTSRRPHPGSRAEVRARASPGARSRSGGP